MRFTVHTHETKTNGQQVINMNVESLICVFKLNKVKHMIIYDIQFNTPSIIHLVIYFLSLIDMY